MNQTIKLLTPITALVSVFFAKIVSESPSGNPFSKVAFRDPFDTDNMRDFEGSERAFETNIEGCIRHAKNIKFTDSEVVKVRPLDAVLITGYRVGQYGQHNMVCEVDGRVLIIPERHLMPYKDEVCKNILKDEFESLIKDWDNMIQTTKQTIQKLHIFRHRNTITIGATNKEGQPLWS